MNDAINRQGVIDFINNIEHRALKMSNDNGEDILYKTVLATTKAIRGYCKIVPPAQPEITLESAIDYLHSINWMQEHDRILEESAQPRIIYCKNCKFTDGKKPTSDGRYWCVRHESFMYFCSDAERGQ